jgi:hypothetical protein
VLGGLAQTLYFTQQYVLLSLNTTFCQKPILKQNQYITQTNFNQVHCSKSSAQESTSNLVFDQGVDRVKSVPKNQLPNGKR